jgi:hypothetical protein
MQRNYSQVLAVIKRIKRDKEEFVYEFTNGKTTSLRALTDREYNDLWAVLEPFNTPPPGDLMRKKMISIAKQMNWGSNTKQIIERLDGWCLKQKFQKKLNQLDVPQLTTMLTVFESKVYVDYLKALNK